MRGWVNFILTACLLIFPLLAGAESLTNRLRNHPSPYLALHGTDPVAWQEWNAETIAKAKRENKLLYVSVGYYACHWCHVMQRESYKNPKIAAAINRDFIPVKVDRELNTGLDDALQDFSARLLKIGGWPLNAFVTPDGYPVYVVLYAPPQDFGKVLTQLSDRWKADSAGVRKLARQAAPADVGKPVSKPVDGVALRRWQSEFLRLAQLEMDEFRGGFGQVSKFPMSPQLSLLIELQAAAPDRQPDSKLAEFLRLTLDQMSTRGLHDQVHGGFFRYTTDPGWETPHFEKMLYDNAQLALIYLRAAEVLREPRYQKIGLDTVDFMLKTLAAQNDGRGGFYTSTSAVDAQGREGHHYLWQKSELEKRLSKDEFSVARRIWKLDAPAAFEFGYLPAEWVATTPGEKPLLQSALKKLRHAREKQSLPKDIKINTGLNGLALSALSSAARVQPSYREAAARSYQFIHRQLASSGRLVKALSNGRKINGAELEDYAYAAQGLLDYADATGDRFARQEAQRIARDAWQLFATDSGWRREKQPLLATMKPEAILADSATASPSAVLLMVSLRLEDSLLKSRTLEAMQWASDAMARDAFSYPSQIRAYRLNP